MSKATKPMVTMAAVETAAGALADRADATPLILDNGNLTDIRAAARHLAPAEVKCAGVTGTGAQDTAIASHVAGLLANTKTGQIITT
ncbi:hypothetical protein [Pseudooceanicola sp.]|uniref:hypothetical protein n=1 Tax=Pseudooceanicola sp. TaxID=1914328 RepID=UPI0026163E3F|nr:hypothetical protein [Pseudooceanicola sp.]MDF1856327.1 hypothetical protein [Pseudooceanicola sp.]